MVQAVEHCPKPMVSFALGCSRFLDTTRVRLNQPAVPTSDRGPRGSRYRGRA